MSEVLEKLLKTELENKDFEDAVVELTKSRDRITYDLLEENKEMDRHQATEIAVKKEPILKEIAKDVTNIWRIYTKSKIAEKNNINENSEEWQKDMKLVGRFWGYTLINQIGKERVRNYLKKILEVYKEMGY